MDVCGLAKARPILCNDSPAFQRRHTSVRCAAESSTYFPCVIHTTFEQRFHIRWCCIDPLRSPALPDMFRASTPIGPKRCQETIPEAGRLLRVPQAPAYEKPFRVATPKRLIFWRRDCLFAMYG